MTTILLPLGPSVNDMYPSGAGNRRHRSKKYINWIKEAGWELAIQRPKRFMGQVELFIEVIEPKDGEPRYDLSNRVKAVEDLLVKHGIIEGDDCRYVRRVCMDWSSEIDGIRVTIKQWGD